MATVASSLAASSASTGYPAVIVDRLVVDRGGRRVLNGVSFTVGLDPVLRADLWARFHDLADGGITLIVSSHVMDEAGRCDHLLLLRDGCLVADSTPQRLRAETGTDDLEEAFLRVIVGRDVKGSSSCSHLP